MIIAVCIARLAALLLRIFKRGATTLPGRLALFLKYDILTHLSAGVRIVCVTGTNGKTTTCALLAHALKQRGCSYFINSSGANMLSGVTTAFLMNATLTGRCKKQAAILECDENSLPLIARYLDAEAVLVTNIFRDQLDRFGEVDHTLAQIRKGIALLPSAVLLLNADDPLSFSLSDCGNRVVSFGIGEALDGGTLSDNRYCPRCGALLQYRYHTMAQLGDYACPRCAYRRKPPAVCLSDISENGFLLTAFGKSTLAVTSLSGIYNLYNYCAAAAVLSALQLGDPADLSTFAGAFGRMEKFSCDGRTVLLLLVKNPVGLTGCIRYGASLTGMPDIAFALNDNEADSTDVSWIWDSDFTPLCGKRGKVYTLGTRAADMALRLKYDGLLPDRVLDGERWNTLIGIIRNSARDMIIFSTYTAMMHLRRVLIEAFGGKEFWE